MMADKWGTADFTTTEFEFKSECENLLEDELVKRLTSKVAVLKGEITRSLGRATKKANEIAGHKASGMTGSNLLLKGLINTGAGYIETADAAKEKLEEAISILIRMLVEITIKDPSLKKKCDEMVDKEENSLSEYEDKICNVRGETMLHFEISGHTTAPNSRDSSPARGNRFRNMKHLLPSILNEECSTLEYKKFKREFGVWVDESYPDGLSETRVWGTLNSRLDASWQEKMNAIDGIEVATLTTIWEEMDKVMMTLHPTHTRRMKFLSTKPTKGQMPSSFIHQMKEQAADAQIDKLTEASLILHLTTAGLVPSELNKAVKTLIIETLRTNPDQKDLKKVVAQIKGIEADFNANGDKSAIRQVTSDKEYLCRLCNKTHSRGKCSISCKHCKKSGSHKPDMCWVKFGKPKVDKDKRDRSASTERNGKSRNSGRRLKSKKSPTRARKTRDPDSETDRDSEAPSETDIEETPPKDDRKSTTRKVRGILKNSARRIKPKKKNTEPANETMTGSGLRDSQSSEDSDSESEAKDKEDLTRKLLNAYKKQIKIRRIKSRSTNSATMYGRIRSKSNKKERFVADSGTGIPIIPIEIVEEHNLEWEKVDPDEPGCE